jgi:hypothetical protein
MSTKIKLKKLRNAINVGDQVPYSQSNGNNGRYFEKEMRNKGFGISNGKGVDIPALKVEIKSRKNGSTSPHTVGVIHGEELISLAYRDTHLYQKLQTQYHIDYNDDFAVVTNTEIYDFSDPFIQQKFEDAYEKIRQQYKAGNRSTYIKGSIFGNLERIIDRDDSWQFRISAGGMKKLKNMAKSRVNYLFNFH